MTSIDELFKLSKRRLFVDEIYKSTKIHANGDVRSGSQASLQDGSIEDDTPAGPVLSPDPDEDGLDDDEEGRFFGGGVTSDTKDILDYVDDHEVAENASEKIDSTWLRKVALNFERRISKNAELRAKFEDQPQKFMGSEADLDADIKALSILSDHTDLYQEFAGLGCARSLVSLLAHENTDIAIDAVEIINELTDEDVDAADSDWDVLVQAMLDADLLDLLSVFENLASKPSISERITSTTSVMPWLLDRICRIESPFSQNKQYAAELLAILLQSSPTNQMRLTELDGVDILLQILAAYRKRDPPKGTEEEEFVENVFDSLTCVVDSTLGKRKFVEAEGVELCMIMLREGMMSKSRALRLLDHCLGGAESTQTNERLVEAAGLKTVFGMFMKKQESSTTEHILGILSSLLRYLPPGATSRIRTLAKFVERDYEKIRKLIVLRRDYASRLSGVDRQIEAERKARMMHGQEEDEELRDEWLGKRMEKGLFCLQSQTVDVILSWLIAEDDGAKAQIQTLLSERDETLDVIKATLEEQLVSVTGEPDGGGTDQTRDDRAMLEALLSFL
ncbi:MAG: hypothetical protein M1817_006326 [Caeruleum heppii]|nr:MAG: hypothetical protein M1817_006326 [Caeruleum heppii]